MNKFSKGELYYVIDSDSDTANETHDTDSLNSDNGTAHFNADNVSSSPPSPIPVVTLDSQGDDMLAAQGNMEPNDDADREQQMDDLFRDVVEVRETLLARYPNMNVDPNVIFEQLEIYKHEANRKNRVAKFLGTLEETYRAQAVDFRVGVEETVAVGSNDAATAPLASATPLPIVVPTPASVVNGEVAVNERVDQLGDVINAVASGHLGENNDATVDDGQWVWRNGKFAVGPPPEPPEDVYEGLMRDVQTIIDMFPNVDATEIYAHLEARRNEVNRIQNVIDELLHGIPRDVASPGFEPSGHHAAQYGIPWYPVNEPNHVADATSDRKRGANAEDWYPDGLSPLKIARVETAANHTAVPQSFGFGASKLPTIALGPAPAAPGLPKVATATASGLPVARVGPSVALPGPVMMPSNAGHSSRPDQASSSGVPNFADWEETQLRSLVDTFPDADPTYLEKIVKDCRGSEIALQELVTQMVELHKYPKLKDRLERERKLAIHAEYSTRNFTVEEILEWFENPLELFYDITKPVSQCYKVVARIQLANMFPKITMPDIDRVLLQTNNHFTPAIHILRQMWEKNKSKWNRRRYRGEMPYTGEPDELFFKEFAFSRTETQIRDHLKRKEMERNLRLATAKKDGSLVTCMCCFDDEGLAEEMVDCEKGHMFCKQCIVRGIDVAFGQGKTKFECMAESCDQSFTLAMLRRALPRKTFSSWLRKIQEDEIFKAGIPDLIQCPFCSFAAIVPNPDDKVFRCLDPDCLKESCRLCKEPNHIPFRCDEVEKDAEVKMRTFIENRMTEALLRKCNKCGRSFVKVEGCNKMTCPCGAHMCYVCRQPIKDYSHFNAKGGCPQVSNTARMHHQEIVKGAEKAKKEFIQQHPELKGIHMKHDPTLDIPTVPGAPKGEPHELNPFDEIAQRIDLIPQFGNIPFPGNDPPYDFFHMLLM